jgi:hypothetical protein
MPIEQIVETPAERAARRYGLMEAGRLFFDQPPHPASITRWILRGILLRSGERLRLIAERQPNRWVVTEAAVRDFIARLTADRLGEHAPSPPEVTASRRRAADRAERELTAIGI